MDEREEAKKIIDDFSKKIGDLEIEDYSYENEREKCFREEKREAKKIDENFINIFFKNAKQTKRKFYFNREKRMVKKKRVVKVNKEERNKKILQVCLISILFISMISYSLVFFLQK